MKKKLSIILSIVLVCIAILFIVYKVDSIKKTKERIINITTELMNSIADKDYDKIRDYIRKTDGTALSNQEISNFLLNTELYRATLLKNEKQIFTYSASANFFNTSEGHIVFTFKALNGDLITNEIKYVNTGINEYLITNKIQECNKEKEKYPVPLDLANGKAIGYNTSSEEEDTSKVRLYSFVQDENAKVSIEVIKEAKEDVKIAALDMMYEELDSLKNINEEYSIEWDNECKEFSVYYDESIDKKIIATTMKLRMQLCAILIQSLDGNTDWHLTINYYDYNTRELLKTESIR